MKTKYTYTVAGQPLSFTSDDDRAFVEAVVAETDKTVTDVMLGNIRCAKLDAALIAALDFCGDKVRYEKRIRSLEAQISLYEATIARMKNVCNIDENGKPTGEGTETTETKPSEPSPIEKLAEAARLLRLRQQTEQKAKDDGKSDEEILKLDGAKAAKPVTERKADAPRDRISELENILKMRRDEKESEGKQLKLGEIEGLLKRE